VQYCNAYIFIGWLFFCCVVNVATNPHKYFADRLHRSMKVCAIHITCLSVQYCIISLCWNYCMLLLLLLIFIQLVSLFVLTASFEIFWTVASVSVPQIWNQNWAQVPPHLWVQPSLLCQAHWTKVAQWKMRESFELYHQQNSPLFCTVCRLCAPPPGIGIEATVPGSVFTSHLFFLPTISLKALTWC